MGGLQAKSMTSQRKRNR